MQEYITVHSKTVAFIFILIYICFLVFWLIRHAKHFFEIKLSFIVFKSGFLCLMLGVLFNWIFKVEFNKKTVLLYLTLNDYLFGLVAFAYVLVMVGLTMLINALINIAIRKKS